MKIIGGRRRRIRLRYETLIEVRPTDDTFVIKVVCRHQRRRETGVSLASLPALLEEMLAAVDDRCRDRAYRSCDRCSRFRWLHQLKAEPPAGAVCIEGCHLREHRFHDTDTGREI